MGVERQPTSQAPCSNAEHPRVDCWQWARAALEQCRGATVLPPPPSSQPPRLGPIPDAMKLVALALVACALAIGASAGEPALCPTTPQLPPPLPRLSRALHVPRSQLGAQICNLAMGCATYAAGRLAVAAVPRPATAAGSAHHSGLTGVLQAPCPSSPTTTATPRAASPRTTAAAPATRRRCPRTRCRSSSSTL